MLHEKYGVMLPDSYEQDWEFTAGNSKHTEDYIDFYNEYPLTLRQKSDMINMILQGFNDLIEEGLDMESIDQIWDRIKRILTDEKELHEQTIKYWSCLDLPLEEDRFYVSKFVREIL